MRFLRTTVYQNAGVLNGSVEAAKVEGIDVLNLNGGYVDIPDGTIGTSDKEVTVNMLVKISENIPASWMWCLGSSNKRYMYFTGCCSEGQGSVMRGGVGCVPTANLGSDAGWQYESAINGEKALTANEWQNITVIYKDGGYFTFYKNGVKVASTKLSDGNAGNFTLQDLMTAGDGRDGYMGWSFYTGNDPKFKGSVADFRIYNKELSESEVTELSDEISDMLEGLKDSDKLSDDKKLKKDEEALDIFNKEDLRGNITLLDKEQRVYYATTRDFNTFSDAKVWIEESGSVIDTTVIKVGEYYYRYTKNEDGNTNAYGTPKKRIYCERSKSLTATTWELVSNNSLAVSGGQIEGPCIFKINTDDVENAKSIAALKNYTLEGDDMYCLIADMTGSTIFPGLATDITKGSFDALGTTPAQTVNAKTLYSMPEPIASHGTIMPITSEEYDKVMKAYDTDYAQAAGDLIQTMQSKMDDVQLGEVSEVKENLTLPQATEDGTQILWTSSDESVVKADGTVVRPTDKDVEVVLTASICGQNDKVRKQTVEKTFKVTVKAKEKESDKQTESGQQTESSQQKDSQGVCFER